MSSWSGGTEFWSTVAASHFSRHLSAAGTHQLHRHHFQLGGGIGCLSNQISYLTCLIDKPCLSLLAFISLLSGVCVSILNCATEPSCPFKCDRCSQTWLLFWAFHQAWRALESPQLLLHKRDTRSTLNNHKELLLTVFLWASPQYIWMPCISENET